MNRNTLLKVFVLLFIGLPLATAQDLSAIFEQGNRALAEDGPDKAYEHYETLWETYKVQSPSLFYNAGIAAVRGDHLGEAVWCFERAAKLNGDPRLGADIRSNLSRVRELLRERMREKMGQRQVIFETFPSLWEQIRGLTPPATWLILATFFGMIAAFIFGWLPHQKTGKVRALGIFVLILFCACSSVAWFIIDLGPPPTRVVITGNKAVLLEGSHTSANEIPAPIEEGQVLLVIDETHPDFVRVEIPNGTHGWLSRAQIEEI
jgi:hypothetical protein